MGGDEADDLGVFAAVFGQQGGQSYGHWQTNSQIYGNPYTQRATNQLAYFGTGGPSSAGKSASPARAACSSVFAIPDEGIRAGSVIGYRAWRLSHGLLVSLSQERVWVPGEPMGAFGGPHDQGGDGVYAYKSRKLLDYHLSGSSLYVTGTVWMWGKIIETEYGYRAEHAEVRSIDHIGDLCGSAKVLREVSKLYLSPNVDVAEQRVRVEREIRWRATRWGVVANISAGFMNLALAAWHAFNAKPVLVAVSALVALGSFMFARWLYQKTS